MYTFSQTISKICQKSNIYGCNFIILEEVHVYFMFLGKNYAQDLVKYETSRYK